MCVWFMMFFVVRSNDSFDFPLGLIKYIVIQFVYGSDSEELGISLLSLTARNYRQ